MARRSIGIVMNGVTGRMGYHQHLVRSILALRDQGGLLLADGTLVWPEPVLVGRNAEKLKTIAQRHQLASWTTDLDSALGDPGNEIYFDAQLTSRRAAGVKRALAAGRHVYVEKPVAATLPEALELARLARDAGLKNGVVQDKLFLPGLIKLGHRSAAGWAGRSGRHRGRLRGTARRRRAGRGPAGADVQPGAGRVGPRAGRLRQGLRHAARPGDPAGHPALAGRHVRPGAARLLGQHRPRSGRRYRAGHHR